MKAAFKQNLIVNVLVIFLMALVFLSVSLMWSQHHQYHFTGSMGHGFYSPDSSKHMNWAP